MSKFTEWLKFYFIGFYNHDLSKDSGNHSFFNALLSLVLTFVIVCCGLVAGYAASFGVHYNNSGDFKDFLYSAFANENPSKRIGLSVKDGVLSAEIPEGNRVNTLLNEGGGYAANGYHLIVDTRPAANLYADFTVKCKKSDNTEIDYAAYRALPDKDKKSYSLSIEFSGSELDPADRQKEYEEFLNGEESVAEAYGKLKSDYAGGAISSEQYANGIYELYFSSYYSGFQRDSYGKAYTLRTYYLSAATYGDAENYITLLDNVCFCSFKTDKGIKVEFSGYFDKLGDGVISGGDLTAEQIQDNVDGMVKKSFSGATGLNFLVYLISLSRSVAIYVMAVILFALILFMVLKAAKTEDCPRYADALKIVGSFQLWSAVLTFALTICFSFFFARGAVFTAAEIILLSVLLLRTAVHTVIELIADKKKKAGTKENG